MQLHANSVALKPKVFPLSLILFVFAGVGVVATGRLLTPPPAVKSVAAAPQPAAPQPAAPSVQEEEGSAAGEALVFNLRPEGFEPAELTIPAGDYLLVFNNRTGLDELALRLDRAKQGTVSQARRLRGKRSWRQALRLTPGSYTVTEGSHSEWTLRLTVTAR